MQTHTFPSDHNRDGSPIPSQTITLTVTLTAPAPALDRFIERMEQTALNRRINWTGASITPRS